MDKTISNYLIRTEQILQQYELWLNDDSIPPEKSRVIEKLKTCVLDFNACVTKFFNTEDEQERQQLRKKAKEIRDTFNSVVRELKD